MQYSEEVEWAINGTEVKPEMFSIDCLFQINMEVCSLLVYAFNLILLNSRITVTLQARTWIFLATETRISNHEIRSFGDIS